MACRYSGHGATEVLAMDGCTLDSHWDRGVGQNPPGEVSASRSPFSGARGCPGLTCLEVTIDPRHFGEARGQERVRAEEEQRVPGRKKRPTALTTEDG